MGRGSGLGQAGPSAGSCYDERTGQTDLGGSRESGFAGVSLARLFRWQRSKHGGLAARVAEGLRRQETAPGRGWRKLSSGGTRPGVAGSSQSGVGRKRWAGHFKAVCPKRTGTKPGGRSVAGREARPPQEILREQNSCGRERILGWFLEKLPT